MSGPVTVRVKAAILVVPGVAASVEGGDDAVSQFEQQLFGGRLRQGVGFGRAKCAFLPMSVCRGDAVLKQTTFETSQTDTHGVGSAVGVA